MKKKRFLSVLAALLVVLILAGSVSVCFADPGDIPSSLGPGGSLSDWLFGPSAGSGLPPYALTTEHLVSGGFSASYYLSYYTPITYTSAVQYNFDVSSELLVIMEFDGGEISRIEHKLMVEPPTSLKGTCMVTPVETIYPSTGAQQVHTGESFSLPLSLLFACSVRMHFNQSTEEMAICYDFAGRPANGFTKEFYQYNYYFDMEGKNLPDNGGDIRIYGTFGSKNGLCAGLLDTQILSGFRVGVSSQDVAKQEAKSAELYELYKNISGTIDRAPAGDLSVKYQEGYSDGKEDGLAEGYQNGYNQAVEDYSSATAEMVTEAEKQAYAKGKNDGLDLGYQQGLNAANGVKDALDRVGKYVVDSLSLFSGNGTVFGMKLSEMIATFVSCLAIIWFVKKVF